MPTIGRWEKERGAVCSLLPGRLVQLQTLAIVFTLAILCGPLVRPGLADPANQSLDTRSVVVVCIDGIRNAEALKNDQASPVGQLPASHPYIPRIWSEIVPFATLFQNCKNVEMTYTTPGFNTILSGAWQFGPNRSRRDDGGFFENRSQAPTIFEHFARIRPGRAWAIINKKNTLLSDFSIHPMFGDPSATQVTFIDPGRGSARYQSDAEVFSESIRVVDEEQPDLLFVNFGSVDLAGHSRSFTTYANTVRAVDGYVADLWAHLQNSSYYQGRTTMILTTDHGRHDDAHGGFVGHGGMCDGCRDLIALVVGPDTPAQVVDRRTYQTDFAPTVGRFLGFKMPFAEGRALEEALGCPPREDFLDQRSPEVATDGHNVFVTYERTRFGKREIHLAVSRDTETFIQDINLTPFVDGQAYAMFGKDPCILINRRNARDLIQLAWLDLNDSEGRWQLRHQLADLTAFQQGSRLRLDPPKVIGASLFEGERRIPDLINAGLIMQNPHLVSAAGPNGRREIVVTSGQRYTMGFRFSDNAFPRGETGNIKSAYPEERYFFSDPRLVPGTGTDLFVVWRDIFESAFTDIDGDTALEPLFNWEIYFARSEDGGETWTPPTRLTHGAEPSLFPRVVFVPYGGLADGPQVIVVYSDRDASGIYQIVMRRGVFVQVTGETRIDFGAPVVLTRSSVGAWYPEILLDRPISGNRLHLVYTDFGVGQSDILYRFSPDGIDFAPPINVSDSPAFSRKPSIAVMDDGRKVVAWEEIDENGLSTLETKVFRESFPVVEEE